MVIEDRDFLLIVGGGIAAYKSLELVRRIRERGGRVRAILTRAGREFVTPLSLASLTGEKVYEDLFSLTDEAEMGHIELSRAADLVIVAPATADLMSKMAHGSADDLASTALLATDKPVLIAPAMNVRMWLHPATRRNLATLRADGILVVGPAEGAMACGEYGPGRMAEPHEIIEGAERALAGSPAHLGAKETAVPGTHLQGRRAVVTSGPTYEPIDPVRFIGNRSSGKQGHAIAAALARLGAETTLVTGPTDEPDPEGVRMVRVETAQEMLTACEGALPADIVVCAAAVADWRVAEPASQKIKKGESPAPSLALVENPDILATLAARVGDRPGLVIGFAAETEEVVSRAIDKRRRKGCNWIVANDVSDRSEVTGGVLGGNHNQVHLVTEEGTETWPVMTKIEVADRLAQRIAQRLAGINEAAEDAAE